MMTELESDGSRIGVYSTQDLSDDHSQYFIYQTLRGLKALHSAACVCLSCPNPHWNQTTYPLEAADHVSLLVAVYVLCVQCATPGFEAFKLTTKLQL